MAKPKTKCPKVKEMLSLLASPFTNSEALLLWRDLESIPLFTTNTKHQTLSPEIPSDFRKSDPAPFLPRDSRERLQFSGD